MRRFRILWVIFLVLFCGGCLTLEQSLRVARDGSVVVSYAYTFRKEDEASIRAGWEQLCAGSPGYVSFWDEAGIQEFYRKKQLELRSYRRTLSRKGEVTIQVVVLGRDAAKILNNGVFGPFVLEGRRLNLTFPRDGTGWPKERRKHLAELCKGLSVKLFLTAPGDLRRTNGVKISSDTASWELPFDGAPGKCLLSPPQHFYIEW